MKEFDAFMVCARGIVNIFEKYTGLVICEYSLSHKNMTFIRYDRLHNRAYLFSERDYKDGIKCSGIYDYYAVNPLIIDNKYATMALLDLELDVNGLLKPKSAIDIIQSRI